MNKKIKGLVWTTEELKVIAKHAGKVPMDQIIVLVNEVSKVIRTELAIQDAGNKRGFKFKVVI